MAFVVSLFLFLFLFQISLQSLWVTFLVLDTTGFDASRFLFLPLYKRFSFWEIDRKGLWAIVSCFSYCSFFD
jgi:hypothetical protein